MNHKYALACFVILDTTLGNLHFSGIGLNEYDAYVIGLLLQMAVISMLIVWLVPYTFLLAKNIAFIFMLSEWWELVQYLTNGAFNTALLIANVAIFMPWLLYAWFRSYDIASVKPKAGMLYRVTKKPHSLLGFILSLWGRATQGSAVWCNGKVYGFHHGEFTVVNRVPSDSLIIATGKKFSEKVENKLNAKVGEMWAWRNNCVTLWWGLRDEK